MIKTSTVRKLASIIVAIYFFIYPQIVAEFGGKTLYPILTVAFILALLVFGTCMRKHGIDKASFAWILILLLSLFRNQGIENGDYLWPFTFATIIMVLLALESGSGWADAMLKILCFCSFIYVIATFILYFFPGIYSSLVSFWGYYPNGSEMGKYGYRAGFADNHSANGTYCIILALVQFCSLITDSNSKLKSKWKTVLLLFLSVIAVGLTTKRAHLVFGIASMLVVYYAFSSKRMNSKIFKGLVALIALMVIYEFAITLPGVSDIFAGFLGQDADVSNGRYAYWAYAISLFKKSPIIGIGWLGFRFNSGSLITGTNTGNIGYVDAHNVYIQLLCENGILGFVFIVAVFVSLLSATIKFYFSNRDVLDGENTKMLAIATAFQVFCLIYGLTGNFLYDRACFIYAFGCALFLYVKNTFTRIDSMNYEGLERLQDE